MTDANATPRRIGSGARPVMPDWEQCWRDVLRRVDASHDGQVCLTLNQIRSVIRCKNQNVESIWWWKLAGDPSLDGNEVRLHESGLDWELNLVKDRVAWVTFTRRK
jgi:hypothetical protein